MVKTLLDKEKWILRKHGLWMLFAVALTCAILGTGNVAEASVYHSKKDAASGPAAEIRDGYLNGAELDLLKSQSDGQMSSSVIVSPSGGVIVVDGGRAEDEQHLVDTINAHGGRVSLWLITHPHDDHLGALTKILDTNPRPVQIDKIVSEEADAVAMRQLPEMDIRILYADDPIGFAAIASSKAVEALNWYKRQKADGFPDEIKEIAEEKREAAEHVLEFEAQAGNLCRKDNKWVLTLA